MAPGYDGVRVLEVDFFCGRYLERPAVFDAFDAKLSEVCAGALPHAYPVVHAVFWAIGRPPRALEDDSEDGISLRSMPGEIVY